MLVLEEGIYWGARWLFFNGAMLMAVRRMLGVFNGGFFRKLHWRERLRWADRS